MLIPNFFHFFLSLTRITSPSFFFTSAELICMQIRLRKREMKNTNHHTYHGIAPPIRHHLHPPRPQPFVRPLRHQPRAPPRVLHHDVLLYEPGFVHGRRAVVEEQDGQLLQRVVLRRLGAALPGDLAAEGEGDALLEQGDAVLARVGGGGGGDEG